MRIELKDLEFVSVDGALLAAESAAVEFDGDRYKDKLNRKRKMK